MNNIIMTQQMFICLIFSIRGNLLCPAISEKNYSQARYHYLHSNDGNNFAAMLIEFHVTAGYSSEVDLFIAQAVLQ